MLACRTEMGTHVISLRVAEIAVEHEGLLPVAAGLTGVTSGMVGAAEAVVRAGLLILITDLAGQAERRGVPGDRDQASPFGI